MRLRSIISPIYIPDRAYRRISDRMLSAKDLLLRYCPGMLTTPLCQGLKWEPALPSDRSSSKRGVRGRFLNLHHELFWFITYSQYANFNTMWGYLWVWISIMVQFQYNIRTFGFLCYQNLSAVAAHKLSPRSTARVFLGF